MDPGNFVYLVSINIWSLGETHILQAINYTWKIISPRASKTPTDTAIFQVAICYISVTQNISGLSLLSTEDRSGSSSSVGGLQH